MEADPSQALPPNNSGSDTFERYYYQAHIAFPYCLNCALGGDVLSVVPEHFEDVALQFSAGWRFIQIKTRDLALAPWKLADLTARGGAFHSLLRTHKLLVDLPATLEVHVEGAIDRRDVLRSLLADDGRISPVAVELVKKPLSLTSEACSKFLERIRIYHSHPSRDTIRAQNTRLLVNHAGHLPASLLDAIYDSFLTLICDAMQAQLLPKSWKSAFLKAGRLKGNAQDLFARKQLTRDHFKGAVAPITIAPQPLLKHIIDGKDQPPTLLEQKLIMGGASEEIIGHAKTLRAFASQKEYEILSSQLYDDALLDNVHERLLIRAHGLVNQHGSGKAPAAVIWNQLLNVLGQHASVIDARGLFGKDPDLLLGAVCDLSDKCKTGWGNADA